MNKLVLKSIAMLTMCSLTTNFASWMPVSASSDSEYDLTSMSAAELEIYADMSAEFGYSSVQSLLEQTSRSFDVTDYIGSIHDIDGDNMFTVEDAQLVLQFVKGIYSYNYSYESLDVDGNLVVNIDDAYIYLQFAAYILTHPELNNYFTSGFGTIPSSGNEARTYVKHDVSSGYSPSSNDTVYTICSDGSIVTETNPWTDPNYSPSTSFIELSTEQAENLRTCPFTRVQDTRVVRCAGTGFIIGEHVIITNAHCVYGLSGYNDSDVCAFTFDSNNEPIRHDLTVVSYYVPMAYIDSSYSNISISLTNDLITAYHDYAIIVVEEDLTSYGKFECGIPLAGLADASVTSNTASYGFPQDEYGMCLVTENGIAYRKYTVASYGGVDGFARGYWIRTTSTEASRTGMSGSPIVLNSVIVNNDTLSCGETVIGISRSGPSSRGDCIVRPILQFFYGNETLNNQVDLL